MHACSTHLAQEARFFSLRAGDGASVLDPTTRVGGVTTVPTRGVDCSELTRLTLTGDLNSAFGEAPPAKITCAPHTRKVSRLRHAVHAGSESRDLALQSLRQSAVLGEYKPEAVASLPILHGNKRSSGNTLRWQM